MRVLFWGTPDFAVPSLRALTGEGHDVVGVVTQPDRPAGRGRAVLSLPIQPPAQAETLRVLQPERAQGDEFLAELRALAPDISIVVAYGQILRREVLELPPRGSLNLHASLLPELRGAAPINWAIIRGHAVTGVTVMRMVERMDAGPILMQAPEPIGEDETASDLWARLSEIGAATLVATLALLEADELPEIEQDEALATYAPRLTRAHARIDWSAAAGSVARQVRGLDAVPGAWTLWRGDELKLFRPRVADAAWAGAAVPGTVLDVEPHDVTTGLLVACGDGALWLREVKPSGKRRMTTAEWVRGRGAQVGERFA
jgi:methionyl-tRNA formyltransferase